MRINRTASRIGVFVATAAGLVIAAIVPAAPATAAPSYVYVTNKHSGKCLEVYAASLDNAGNVVQWDCWGGDNQQWVQEDPDGDGWYQFRNRRSGKCLEVYAFSLNNGGDVVQWDCWGGNNQQWRYEAIGSDGIWLIYGYRNKHSGKCLEVYAFSPNNGGDVVQWDCWGGNNQQWNQRYVTPPIIK